MIPHLLRCQGFAVPPQAGRLHPWSPWIWGILGFCNNRVNFKMLTRCRVDTCKLIFLFLTFVSVLICTTDSEADDKTADWFKEIKSGVLLHDVGGLWCGNHKETGTDLNVEIVLNFPVFSIISEEIYPNFGLSLNDSGNTSNIYSGFIWDRKIMSALFLNLGLGIAVHNCEIETTNENKKNLGSHILFRIPVEIGFILNKRHRFSFFFVHLSNAYLADPNEGMDDLGVRYGYHF